MKLKHITEKQRVLMGLLLGALLGGCTAEAGEDGEPGPEGPQGAEGPQGPQGPQGAAGESVDSSFETCPNAEVNNVEAELIETPISNLCVYHARTATGEDEKRTWAEAVRYCVDSGFGSLCFYEQLTRACFLGYDILPIAADNGEDPLTGGWLADRIDDDDALAINFGGPGACGNFDVGPAGYLEVRKFACCAEYPIYPED